MIKHSQDYTKRALSELLDDLISVSEMLMHYNIVLLVFVIKAKINQLRIVTSHYHHSRIAAARSLRSSLLTRLLFTFNYIKEVNGLKFEYLCFLIVPKQGL